MYRLISILIVSFLLAQSAKATDTTSVRILFSFNEYKLSDEEKGILNDVNPSDSSIVLKNIRIYGYCDPSETENKQNPLSFLRANEVKQYLLSKGIVSSLISIAEGKGKQNKPVRDTTGQQNRSVSILIDYESKVTEQTIIIKSKPKKMQD
jgi:OOP family OmpA-OmpF porin